MKGIIASGNHHYGIAESKPPKPPTTGWFFPDVLGVAVEILGVLLKFFGMLRGQHFFVPSQ
jgi:hypothetical protein